jgi:type I restriction enzyme S subunit
MELERLNAASAIPGLNRNDAYNLNTLVPPLSEQRKIATVLHTVDQAIQKTEQIIEQTKRYKSGLKQDIFRGGIGDNTTKELPAIGEIPECWDITTLEDVSEWITDGTHTPYDAKQEGFPCLTGKNIRDYGFNLDDIKLVSEKAFEEMRSRVSPEQGDVLFVKDGSIGYTQVNDLQFEFGLLESVLLIRTNKNKIRPHYLQQLLTWKPFRELLISRRVGTGIERMTISGMKKAEVILPSLEEQNEIEDILLQVDKYIDNESKYLSRLKRFKKGLMQDLLSGEVRTTDVDIDIPEEVAKYG